MNLKCLLAECDIEIDKMFAGKSMGTVLKSLTITAEIYEMKMVTSMKNFGSSSSC